MTEQNPQHPPVPDHPPVAPAHPVPPAVPARRKAVLYAAIASGALAALVAGTVGYVVGSQTAQADVQAAPTTVASPETSALGPVASITPGPGNTGPSSAPAPSPTTAEPIPTPSPTQSEPACSKFEKMSDREFKLLAKNPYEHLGKCYRIYGYVTQADSATGSLSVRANACGEKHQPTYGFISDCDTNSFFTELGGGDGESGIDNIVDGDAFEADVEVGVPYTYTTTLGGQMTAPKFHLHKITKYATTK